MLGLRRMLAASNNPNTAGGPTASSPAGGLSLRLFQMPLVAVSSFGQTQGGKMWLTAWDPAKQVLRSNMGNSAMFGQAPLSDKESDLRKKVGR